MHEDFDKHHVLSCEEEEECVEEFGDKQEEEESVEEEECVEKVRDKQQQQLAQRGRETMRRRRRRRSCSLCVYFSVVMETYCCHARKRKTDQH